MNRLGFAANVATTVLATLVVASIAYAGATGLRFQRTSAEPQPAPTKAASLATPPPLQAKPSPPVLVPPSPTPSRGPFAVDEYVLDEGTGWMLVSDCALFSSSSCRYAVTATSDGGRAWTVPVQVGPAYATNDGDAPRNVIFANRLDGFVYGHKDAYVTHDAGKTWMALPVAAVSFSSIAVGGQTAWVVSYPCAKGVSCQAEVRSSTDGGRTWSAAHKLPSGFSTEQAVPFPGGVVMSSVPNGDIVITTDSGVTWRSIKTACTENPFRAYVATSDGVELWELCHGSPSSGGQVLTSSLFLSEDGGQTWSTLHPSLTLGGNLPLWIVSPSPHAVLAPGMPAAVVTHDAGKTWSQVFPNLAFAKIFWLTQGTGMAMDANRFVYQTSDGGETWEQVGSLPDRLP